MGRAASYVAVYDLSDGRERNRTAKVLEGFGLRVQYSAFELRLTPSTRQNLLRRLEELKLASGFVFLYRRASGRDRAAVGTVPENFLDEPNHAWVVAPSPPTASSPPLLRAPIRRVRPVAVHAAPKDGPSEPALENRVLSEDFIADGSLLSAQSLKP